VDKPPGPTSHDVVAAARRALRTRRVGHAGTLDPFASGLLPLLVGRGTRLMPYVVGFPKRYTGVLRLGIVTDTDDGTGTIVAEHDGGPAVSDEALAAAMTALTGTIQQLPPTYSAKKVGGTPAHRRARRGEVVTLAPRTVEVHQFAMADRAGADVTFAADVGSGTYVRALARDLGLALGCGAHLRELRRTGVGPWHLRDAVPFDALVRGDVGLAPLLAAVPHLPRRDVTGEEAAAVRHGRPVPSGAVHEGPVAVLQDGALLAIAVPRGDVLQPHTVLAE